MPSSKSLNTILPGTFRITINSCFLNTTVKRPYIIITLGDQSHRTSTSDLEEGSWNESFELKVSYHNQLFDTVQLDLFDNNLFFPDKHIGRAEIRLKNLEGMPETFDSYYEVVDKKLSMGATSQVSRKTIMTSGVGAIQAQIGYRYRYQKESRSMSVDLTEMNMLIDQQKQALTSHVDQSDADEREMATEFQNHLETQRARDSEDIEFRKFEEGQEEFPDDSTNDDIDDDDEMLKQNTNAATNKPYKSPLTLSVSRASTMSEATFDQVQDTNENNNTILGTVGSFFGYNNNKKPVVAKSVKTKESLEKINTQFIPQEEDTLKSFPILDTIGSWTMAKETNQVLRAIGKILVAYGQGLELSNLQILSGFNVVEKFYGDLPRDRTWDLVQNASEIEMASYMWRYAMASYGWKGLNFIGKGNGIFSDAVRDKSDALSICEHLNISEEDLLAYELRTSAAFRPSYYIALDKKLNAIVLSIRGTMSTFDTMTDLVCEYEPWKGGLVHKGMKSSANWFFRHIGPKLIAYVNKHSTKSLYIVGHSLGASTSAILTIMLQDYINEFRKGKDGDFTIQSFGYAPACGLSLDLADKYKDQIQSIVFADDFVSKLSYGSMMDVKELIIAGAEAAENIGISELLWSTEPESKKWKVAFERVAECRKRCLESMANPRLYIAGTVYQFWLDPIPKNETRIVIERTTPEKVSTELIIRMSILLDHLPTNFDVAFARAMETLNLSKDETEAYEHSGAAEHIAEMGLKGTTERGGGQGHVLGQSERR